MRKIRMSRIKNRWVITGLVTGSLFATPLIIDVHADMPRINTQKTASSTNEEADDNYTLINRNDFLEYFTQNGMASNNYNNETGIQTFTTTTNQAGNITFKNLINLDYSFEIRGAINVGKATALSKVADGIGFAFYQGERTQYSTSNNIYGGNVGIYGVPNVFGWKLDTYANGNDVDGDSDEGLPTPYGAFVSTDATGKGTIDKQSVQGMGSDFTNGEMHSLVIKYDASTKILSIVLEGTTFSESLADKINTQDPEYSFSVAASTGSLSAVQAFRFDSMKYVAYQNQNATINYIDENTGKTLATDEISGVSNSLVTYPDIKIEDYENEGYEVDTSKTDLTKESKFDNDDTKNQTFSVYLKHKTSTTTSQKAIKRTISYEYEDGTKAAEDSQQQLIFRNTIVKDEVTNESTSTWEAVAGTTFIAVDSPVITGYKANNVAIPVEENIKQDSEDENYVVKYSPKNEQAIIRFVDATTGKVIFERQINGKFGTSSNYNLIQDIALIGSQGYFVKESNIPKTGIQFNQDGQSQIYSVKVLPIEITPKNTMDSQNSQTVYKDKVDEYGVAESKSIDHSATGLVQFVEQNTGKVIKSDILPKQKGFYPVNVVAATLKKHGYQVQSNWNGAYDNEDGNQKNIKVSVSKDVDFQKQSKLVIENYAEKTNYSFRDNLSQDHNVLLNQFFNSSNIPVDVNHTLIPKSGGGGAGGGHEVSKILAVLAYSVNFSRR